MSKSKVIPSGFEYESKMHDFLSSIGATHSSTCFENYNEEGCDAIQSLRKTRESLLVMHSAPPQVYSLVKIHKANHHIRPVVAFHCDPTYLLTSFLNVWFRHVTGFVLTHSVSSSVEFANRIKDQINPLGSNPVSFDVQSMYIYILMTESNLMTEILKK